MMSAMKGMENKHVKQYTCLFSDSAPVEGPNRKKVSEGITKTESEKNANKRRTKNNKKHN